ncbi:hypothetical protein OVA14_04765 [Agrococcus sp. SL85]|uniref:hypothetical protein n=1 Tax=Agrococcus sp. SL85 TaxID=2995141 RepID=UPI00226CCCC3|nr:hypothetical protein [Agrococcus sp. SL85]WAC67070.1 hypothetical protein OVA14_04765 [Agrococcus sp. SL85]
MSRSSRSLNRTILVVLGLAWLAGGAWLLATTAAPQLLAPVQPTLDSAIAAGTAGLPLDWALVGAIAGAALLVLAIVHATTRGRGRTAEAAVVGDIRVDRAAVLDLFEHALGDDPDVLQSSVQPWRSRRGRRSWRIAVTVRTGARLDEVLDRTAEAARATRTRLGVGAPIVLHLGGGLRAAVAHTKRAE